MYTVLAANMLESAMGSDFGISKSPGFMQGPVFISQVTAPGGEFFNYADCGDYNPGHMAVILSWFAAKTGNTMFFKPEILQRPESLGRMAGPGLVWASQFKPDNTQDLSTEWFGDGKNPVAVFRDPDNDFYLAMKGGKANLSHGNMDAGTFVFELNGIRWIMDPGNQSYYPLNRIGFNLAGHCQDCPRWTLLTKKNQGHSTITINNERFDVNATAQIIDFTQGKQPEITIDMTPLYFGNVDKVTRRFVKESNASFYIEDTFVINKSTENINWGLMTVADVQLTNNGAVLTQEGKELLLEIEAPEGLVFSVISLDPPPLEIDKTIKNLKRIEINIPAWTINNNQVKILVRCKGN
jgi:hypothetical protein